MRRWISITLLALGTVLGYGFAFHSMRYHHRYYDHDAWCGHDGWDRRSFNAPAPAPPPAPSPSPQ